MLLYAHGSETASLTPQDLKEGLYQALDRLGPRRRVLALPPDITRYHSRAGELTVWAYQYYGAAMTDVMPALGTHSPMTEREIGRMFPGIPLSLFREHRWRTDVVTLGEVPAAFVGQVSQGRVSYPWPAQVNRLLVEGRFDLILSPGQVVPHEVVGMANHSKNIFVGTGGQEGINRSHFIGAAYGMERMMGRADTPVRRVLNYASDHFARHLPIIYIQTVLGKAPDGSLRVRGLYIGDDYECFRLAAELSQRVNLTLLDKPLGKVVVYLDPQEFKSTWLGNKSIYRTRMAIADGGELVVLAPGLREFGEDRAIDGLIRRYGYRPSAEVLALVEGHEDLKRNLGAAAHLIHGSPEGRFTVTYCPGQLTREAIEGVGFRYAPLGPMMQRYNPERLTDGPNTLPDGEEIFYISNPAIGLWASRERFVGS